MKSHKKYFTVLSALIFSMGLFFLINVSLVRAQTHPSLLFNDIKETPGYQNRTKSPWSDWEKNLISNADDNLKRDFSQNWDDNYNRMGYRAEFSRDLALVYQITKDKKYAEKAKEGLLNMDKGDAPAKIDKSWALSAYSLAYDWVELYLSKEDDSAIRDNLATLADMVYRDLNDSGADLKYVAFYDYHGQAYPDLGIAALALYDYNNPNELNLMSGPDDWLKVATDYLFINDELHDYNRSLISFGFDEVSGKNLSGSYKSYVLDNLIWWAEIYNHFFNKSLLEQYPILKKVLTSEIWESLPNGYSNNFITLSNVKYTYFKDLLNILDDDYRSYALSHLDLIENSDLLLYSNGYDYLPYSFRYCIYKNYSTFPRKNPDWTSYLNKDGIYQVFRKDWTTDSDWLSLITFNADTNNNRENGHHDQLSIEYYSKGDLLLADAGEDKNVLERYYGEYEIHHNSVSIEDPRKPFSIAGWSNNASRGIFKGNSSGLATPVLVNTLQTPWIELVDSKATINQVIGEGWSYGKNLSSPIDYNRIIFYPDKDYFIIIDRFKSNETWVYRNIFRPTSLNIKPTVDINKDSVYLSSEIGNVKVDLSINNKPFDWLSLSYKKEKQTGVTTSDIKWNTTNPYGKQVNMDLFSVPSSEIRVTKSVGRIAGPNAASEVFNPVVYFRSGPAKNLYRVTALLPKYSTETGKTVQELSVKGTGNAIKILASGYQDYIYSGNGTSSFLSYGTDAETLFIRKTTDPVEFTFLNGSYLNYYSSALISSSQKLDYVSLKKDGDKIFFKLSGNGKAIINLKINPEEIYQIKRDGQDFSTFVKTGDKLVITTDLSEHYFEVFPALGNFSILSSPILNLKANNSVSSIALDYNNSAILSWSAINTDSCFGSGGWSGPKSISGSESTGPLAANKTFSLNCFGKNGFKSASIMVTVNVKPQPQINNSLKLVTSTFATSTFYTIINKSTTTIKSATTTVFSTTVASATTLDVLNLKIKELLNIINNLKKQLGLKL